MESRIERQLIQLRDHRPETRWIERANGLVFVSTTAKAPSFWTHCQRFAQVPFTMEPHQRRLPLHFLLHQWFPSHLPENFYVTGADPELWSTRSWILRGGDVPPELRDAGPVRLFAWRLQDWHALHDTVLTWLHVCERRLAFRNREEDDGAQADAA